eukprot:403377125
MTIDLDEFKQTKREIKQINHEISDLFDYVEEERAVDKKLKSIGELKQNISQADKLLAKLESQWEMLNSQSKGAYKAKLTQLRSEYEQARSKYLKLERSANSEQNKNKIMNQKDAYQQREDDIREKLLNGVDELNNQEKQLGNTKKLGMEAGELMRAANKDLRDQRDILVNVQDKNANIRADLSAGDKIVVQMTRREYIYRIALNITIILLLMAIIAILIKRLIK